MSAEAKFDLVVIGAGPGGYVAAIRAAQLGMKVACVEMEKALGGTCLRVGCIPSKALLESSHLYHMAKAEMESHGIKIPTAELDLDQMLKRKDGVVNELTGGIDFLFKKNKITRYIGRGSIAGKNLVKVANPQNGDVTIEAGNILIATGSISANLPGIEMDFEKNGDLIGTSTEALDYSEVPAHLVVIGAGVIGLELGSVWGRLGSKVTVLEYLPRILPGMDTEMAKEAQKILTKQGFEFHLNTKVTGATVKDGKCLVTREGGDDITCDKVLVAVGRKPASNNLGLEDVGAALDKRGFIQVDDHFKAAEGVYAIGDVVGGAMLAHKAEEEGIACVEMLAGKYGHVDYGTIPGVVYTDPEIASVGKTEDELKEAGVKYKKGSFPFMANGRAKAVSATTGKVKVLADEATDRVLGIHIIGSHAGDLIAEAAVAMAFHASSEDIAMACHAHPTLAEAIKEAAMGVHGRTIHI